MRATYRLQLSSEFGFADAAALVPSLAELGISHLYLSPIFKARSPHGYDVTDPTVLGPALGSFEQLVSAVRANEMGIVIDVVPNHMSASAENPWWTDVLERGQSSEFARVFDVDWERGDGRVVLPSYERKGVQLRNYRRFFDIDDLVGVRVEDPWVFDLTHPLAISLVRDGLVDGLRIDHIDGLRDPLSYLRRLRSFVGDECPIFVEKIFARGEQLPRAWPVQGTTGYDFIDVADGLFVDPRGFRALKRGFPPYAGVVERAKREVVTGSFAAEVAAVVDLLGDDAPRRALREALVEITVHLDVYRTYADSSGMSSADRGRVRAAAAKSKVRDAKALRIVRDKLINCDPLEMVLRWQQLSGPAMAKGAEDTALYRWPVLISRNEVGCLPGDPPTTPSQFHAWASARSRTTMNASSTHDTKRSEDVRARIDALSVSPDVEMPSGDMERYFYQTVVGSYVDEPDYTDRIVAVMLKSVREMKQKTSWAEPSEEYERYVESYVRERLDDEGFVRGIKDVLERFEPVATANSLARVVLKIFTPGVPDFYQGAESALLRLVDPDNRAPFSFRPEGLKYEVTRTVLDVRRRFEDVIERGSYEPLPGVAFVRRLRKRAILVAVPQLDGRAEAPGEWRDAFAAFPEPPPVVIWTAD